MENWILTLASALILSIPTTGLFWIARKEREDLLRNQISQHQLSLYEWGQYLARQQAINDKNEHISQVVGRQIEIVDSRQMHPEQHVIRLLGKYGENIPASRYLNTSISKVCDSLRLMLHEMNQQVDGAILSFDIAMLMLDDEVGEKEQGVEHSRKKSTAIKDQGDALLKTVKKFGAECFQAKFIVSKHIAYWKKYEDNNGIEDLMNLKLRKLQEYRKSLVSHTVNLDKCKQEMQEMFDQYQAKKKEKLEPFFEN